MSVTRTLISIAAVLTLLTAIGCQSSPAASSAMETPGRAVVISGNTGSYTVFVPSADKAHVDVLASSGAQVCPDCKAAAEHYFLTGEMVSKCPTCGATRTIVTQSSGHN